MAKILIADDEHAICEAFSELLRREGHTPLVASSGQQALQLVEQERPEVVFMDVQMPNMGGLAALADINSRHPELPVIVMTAYGTIHTAMEAMHSGAFDYLGKPVELPQIRSLLERALHRPQPATASDGTQPPAADAATTRDQLVGCSPAMQEIFKLMGLLTSNDLTVLVTGESGVGKELVARGIHAHGKRKDRQFVTVNCAAIPEQLIESELFGHEKGAFTGAGERRIGRFEAAADGTLFLDEISELPYHLQSKLLRALQEKSFERIGSVEPIPLRARIIAATNRKLDEDEDRQVFRRDLYHRLNLANVNIPPLRERKEDIDALAAHFLTHANAELDKQIKGIEPAALQRLQQHDWPGNVRELQHTIKRAALIARSDLLTIHDLTIEATDHTKPIAELQDNAMDELRCAARNALRTLVRKQGETSGEESLFQQLEETMEQSLIVEALRITNGNQVAASKLLGLNRTTLRKKMR